MLKSHKLVTTTRTGDRKAVVITTTRTGNRKATVTIRKPEPDGFLATLKFVFIDGFQVFDSPIQPKHRTSQQIRQAVNSLE